jgi:protein-tyrosine phosphatase
MIPQISQVIRRTANAIGWRVRCHWAAANSRSTSRLALAQSPLRRILVICHGNIFRSPFAAELLRMRISGDSEVRSSGFHPVPGRRCPAESIAIAEKFGVSLLQHRSAVLTVADVEWADTIVLMDRHNWKNLCELKLARGKIVWLGAMDEAGDVADPYGMPEAEATDVMRRVQRCASALAKEVQNRRPSSAS